MDILIKDFKLRDRMFGDYSYETEDGETGTKDEFVRGCNSPVHPDLLKAWVQLKPHVAVMMGWQVALLKHDAAALDCITIASVDFENRNSCSIKFKYVLPKLGYITKIPLPKVDFALDVNNYPFMPKFKKVVDDLYQRVEDYHNGEYGIAEQLALSFQKDDDKTIGNKEEKDTEPATGEKEAPAKGARKSKVDKDADI